MAASNSRRTTSLGSLGDNVNNPTIAQRPEGASRMVYERRSFDTNIWRLDLAHGLPAALTRVASSSADDTDPTLSPDGNELLVTSNRSGRYACGCQTLMVAMLGSC